MDVGGWLRSLGLEKYEAAFRENEIDDTVLPRLTAEDLKDLGVGIVGHRRKLLDAIALLNAEASVPAPSLSDAYPTVDKVIKDTAERRQVTVMFSDLVGGSIDLPSRQGAGGFACFAPDLFPPRTFPKFSPPGVGLTSLRRSRRNRA